MENYCSLERVAAYLDVSPNTVRRLMLRGLPYTRVGARLRFKLSQIDDFLAVEAGVGQSRVVPLQERRTA